jgi:XRE family transcriptional regulator, regulator of sulfur utilization
MSEILLRLGRNIRTERKRRGFTQEILAEKAHLSTAFIGQIERGQNVASLISLEKIGRALGLSPSHLLNENPKKYRSAAGSHEKLLYLVRERPSAEQKYIYDTVKTLIRRMNKYPSRRTSSKR